MKQNELKEESSVDITDIMKQSILIRSEPIDGRNLVLDLSFSDMGMDQVEDVLSIILERFLIPLSSKCVCDLECEDRRLKAEKLQATFMMHLEKNRYPSATADIFFKDGPIKKKGDLREFYYPQHGSRPNPYSDVSADYRRTLAEMFGEKLNGPCDADSFMQLVSIEKTKFLATPNWSEAGMILSSDLSSFTAGRYSITLKLETAVSAFEQQELIAFFAELATELASINDTCKGAVMLDSNGGQYLFAHASMFSSLPSYKPFWLDGKETHPYNWYNSHYLLGAEWFNILPQRFYAALEPRLETIKDDRCFQVTRLANGNTIVRFTKGLMEMNLQDMYAIRNVLAPMLRPGVGFVHNGWDFRQRWEMRPIQKGEFHIMKNGSVVLKYNLESAPYIDKQYLCPSWNERF